MTSMARRREHDDSGEYSDASQDIEHNNSRNDGAQPESDYDSQASESDNSERDPENKETERRVDDDEDRSNPQYIPKRGTFYEHDDRTAASGEESNNTASETASEKKEGSETPGERRRPPRKSESVNKWSHDKYNENEQVPKSREELVAIYGYDIRNEDAPPHARRNRRYGRGPNKYTRTWEDEEAYRRQSAAQATPRKPPTAEDFPELDAPGRGRGRKPRTPRPRSKSQPADGETLENGTELRRNASIRSPKKPAVKPTAARNVVAKPQAPKPQKEKMPQLENLTITTSVNNQGQAPRKVNAAVAQQRPVPTDQAKKKPPAQPQPQQQTNPPPTKTPPQQQPPAQQQQQKPQPQQQNQQQQQPSGGGSKRYSSLRQRPLAEPYSPQQQPQQQRPQQQQQPQPQQQHRYHAGPGEFVQGQAAPHLLHQQVRVAGSHAASPPHHAPQPHAPQVRLGLMEQQQIVSHPHHLPQPHTMPQPHTIGQLQPSQGYAPPAMMPAQYMQQQSGSGAVFGGAMLVAPHAPHAPHAPYSHPAQMYPAPPHHNYASQAGGVTYYNCVEQEQQPRAQRRPTAAIPIVRPQINERPANSSEKDNIDRIVENMFVRKPWPATHGADSKEKQPENRSSQEPPSKESSQPNSLTSSSISTDSKPSESREEKSEEVKEVEKTEDTKEETVTSQESIATDA